MKAFISAVHLKREAIEPRALQSFARSLKVFVHYTHDCFSIIKTREVSDFLEHLNSFESAVQFTAEREKDHSLPFLDVLVK